MRRVTVTGSAGDWVGAAVFAVDITASAVGAAVGSELVGGDDSEPVGSELVGITLGATVGAEPVGVAGIAVCPG